MRVHSHTSNKRVQLSSCGHKSEGCQRSLGLRQQLLQLLTGLIFDHNCHGGENRHTQVYGRRDAGENSQGSIDV